MFGNFTTVEVMDPHQTSRLIWESMPHEEKALEDESHICSREFTVVDRRDAQAAGCSVRALQMAFDRFRGTRPMAALRRIRLEQARSKILNDGRTESIARIAAVHGFSTPSRFAQLYRRTYGVYPSEALRGH